MEKAAKTIILSGGGTGGSVTPLLALASELIKDDQNIRLVFVGSESGPERELVRQFKGAPIIFLNLPSGKWRRYFSFHNFSDLFKIVWAFLKSFGLLRTYQPEVIISAGSFLSVPLVFAAFFKKIPIVIHQQDIRPGLANQLMAPLARVVTVTFEKSLIDYSPRAVLIGNPHEDFLEEEERGSAVLERYGFTTEKPLVIIIGGGTGSRALNELTQAAKEKLVGFTQVFHVQGTGRAIEASTDLVGYQAVSFISHRELLKLMAASQLVVSRCGLGVLTELAALGKPAILIPMPGSHQEDNAAVFSSQKAALVRAQADLDGEKFGQIIKETLENKELLASLGNNIKKIMKPAAARSLAALVWEIIK